MKKFLHYIPFFIILCTTVLLFVSVNKNGKNAGQAFIGESPMIGKNVADNELDTIYPAGGKLKQVSFKGKYSLINMFASWCVACQSEHKIFSRLKGEKLQMVGIAWRDKEQDTKEWLQKYGNPFDVVGKDSQGKYGILMGITGIPETFLVGPDGKILMHYKGPVTEDNIKEMLDKAK